VESSCDQYFINWYLIIYLIHFLNFFWW
jgi:hypothetical protein